MLRFRRSGDSGKGTPERLASSQPNLDACTFCSRHEITKKKHLMESEADVKSTGNGAISVVTHTAQ